MTDLTFSAALIFDARYHGESTGDYGTYGYYKKLDSSKAID